MEKFNAVEVAVMLGEVFMSQMKSSIQAEERVEELADMAVDSSDEYMEDEDEGEVQFLKDLAAALREISY